MLKSWAECIGSLFVKNMTIGIAAFNTSIPENGQTFACQQKGKPLIQQ